MSSSLPNLKILPFGGAGAVQDADQIKSLSAIKLDIPQVLDDVGLASRFLDRYYTWLSQSTNKKIHGLEQFSHRCYTNATTEAFDKFYLKNRTRRFRCFRGEYMYHILSWRNCFTNWIYLDEAPLHPMDAVVISYPFADTGGKHSRMDEILDICSKIGVPVLLDCAYFGIAYDLEIDLTWPCITDVTFSLSKNMPLSHCRIGMRLTRIDDDDPLFVINKTNYTNRIGAAIGYHMLDHFGPDYIPDKYRTLQHQWCEKIGATPSNTVIFGMGDQRWSQYDRGAGNHRLSFHKYLGFGVFPDDVA